MRPRILDVVEEQLDQEINGTSLYVRAGYTSKTSFINEAIKEKIEREKEQLNKNND